MREGDRWRTDIGSADNDHSNDCPAAGVSLATLAPDYEAMRQANAKCERVDEIAHLADLATAAQAYYRQSLDVENEISVSRIRVRAERRLEEVLKRMTETGGALGSRESSIVEGLDN